MKLLYNLIMVLIFMTILIIEKSTCFEIMIVGLLFGILLEIEKNKNINKF